MVSPEARPVGAVDPQFDDVADLQGAACQRPHVEMKVAQFLLGVLDREFGAVLGEHHPPVAHLAAGFTVEGGLVDDDDGLGAGRNGCRLHAIDEDGDDPAFGHVRFVAQEFGGPQAFAQPEPDLVGGGVAGARPSGPRGGPLLLHGLIKPR